MNKQEPYNILSRLESILVYEKKSDKNSIWKGREAIEIHIDFKYKIKKQLFHEMTSGTKCEAKFAFFGANSISTDEAKLILILIVTWCERHGCP